MVRDSYSLASIWFSRRTARGVLGANFLTLTFLVEIMVQSAARGAGAQILAKRAREKSGWVVQVMYRRNMGVFLMKPGVVVLVFDDLSGD